MTATGHSHPPAEHGSHLVGFRSFLFSSDHGVGMSVEIKHIENKGPDLFSEGHDAAAAASEIERSLTSMGWSCLKKHLLPSSDL